MSARIVPWIALSAGILAGTIADRPSPKPSVTLGGYRVLSADLHSHSSTFSEGVLTPLGLVLEAESQGLDVLGITGHSQVSDAKVGRWFSKLIGGPVVLVGQEIRTKDHHVIGLGTDELVDPRASVADEVDAIHRQGGVAIAPHPHRESWDAFDDVVLRKLDGAEICHPAIYSSPKSQREFEDFAARAPLAEIGVSDFHATGRLGSCRTYIFASDDTASSVLAALRAHRTVVYGLNGKAYGDPALIALAAGRPELAALASIDESPGWLDWISRTLSACGLFGLIVGRRRDA